MIAGAAPARQKRRTDRTRARLLDAAREVFCERGYDAASLAEITARADLGTGTLYLHFRDKRGLYEAMVRREALSVRERWLAERAASSATPTNVSAEVRLLCEIVLESWSEAKPALMKLVLLDGPQLETWFLEDVGRVIAPVLAQHVADADLLANLVIGVLLAGERFRLTQAPHLSSRTLADRVARFCAAGIAAARPASPLRSVESRLRSTKRPKRKS
jgi:AcrR family transcriptional regulator